MNDKVVIPQHVADWVSYCKFIGISLLRSIELNGPDMYISIKQKDVDQIKSFLKVEKNIELFVRAWLYGYEVYQEKLYTVEIPNNGCTLVLASTNGRLSLRNGYKHNPTELTEAEIRKDFDWAWRFRKEVE